MRVGVVDLLCMPASHWLQAPYRLLLTKQYAGIMPQAVAVWCRRRGHEVFYTAYSGAGDLTRLLPDDLDVVFVSSFTHVSPLAYALAKLYRSQGAVTVLGGPHARAFPDDSLRFFDLVVQQCDEALVASIVDRQHELGQVLASPPATLELPTVEERMPEIRRSAFWRGHRYPASTIPLLASTGCPYSCNFCIDWDNPYRAMPIDHLQADLAYIARELPRIRITFHDPNLASGWDRVLTALETVPPARRSPSVVEASLVSLKNESRLQRLRDTRCQFVCFGIESWSGYSSKAGAGRLEGSAKVEQVVAQFQQVAEYVPYTQASFVFGLDVDQGDEPVAATKQFMDATPYVWPAINIPQPFGNTPLFDTWRGERRLLEQMPFYFYQTPFLVMIPKHYEAIDYYGRVVDLLSHAVSRSMLRARLAATRQRMVQAVHATRTLNVRHALSFFRRTLDEWRLDHQVRAFHSGESTEVPAVYERILDKAVAPLRGLITRADLTPTFA